MLKVKIKKREELIRFMLLIEVRKQRNDLSC
jgi:hypothetical protein